MTTTVNCPEDAVNAALISIGHPRTIANIMEGSDEANAALQVYSQTRDEMLRGGDWYFAQTQVVATLLKSAPANGYPPPVQWDPATNPIFPWRFEYDYPADCLKVRNMIIAPPVMLNVDPQPTLWREGFDPDLGRKVVFADVQFANMVYTKQVTNPTNWEADFTEAFIKTLGRALVPLINPKAGELAVGAENAAKATAEKEQG